MPKKHCFSNELMLPMPSCRYMLLYSSSHWNWNRWWDGMRYADDTFLPPFSFLFSWSWFETQIYRNTKHIDMSQLHCAPLLNRINWIEGKYMTHPFLLPSLPFPTPRPPRQRLEHLQRVREPSEVRTHGRYVPPIPVSTIYPSLPHLCILWFQIELNWIELKYPVLQLKLQSIRRACKRRGGAYQTLSLQAESVADI